jgi:ABC-type polysaccharide/polyol phosphate export permease
MKKNISTEIYDSSNRPRPAVEDVVSLIQYRDVISQLIRRDLVTRYKRSFLGVAWTMLNPLGTMIVLTIVFSQIFGRGQAYPIYVLTGLTVWNFFSWSTRSSMVSMISGSNLFDRIYLPRTSFVVASVGTSTINLLFSMVPLLLIMLILRQPIPITILLFPIPVILLAIFSLGVALIISTYVVFFPDITEIYPILITAWMYLSPVMIPIEFLQKILNGWVIRLNPMSYLIELFRDMVFYGQMPTFDLLVTACILSFGVFFLGWYMFTKRSDRFTYDA